MKHPEALAHEHYPDTHHDNYSRTTFGFWIYLLTDFVLFGTLFACYAVLGNNTFGGPSARDLFQLPFELTPTLILLVCSLTVGLGSANAYRKNKRGVLVMFGITFLLGVIFMGMEVDDMIRLVRGGNGWQRSAFLSMYFSLIGTFAVHMIFALLWIPVLLVPVCREKGISHVSLRRLVCLKMFWQFLNIIWVFIFSFVYLLGQVT